MNIRVDLSYSIKDGTEVVFRSPVDCSAVTGLIVYYPGDDGNTTSKEFAFADAHGNNVGDIDYLFAEDVIVKVILDVTSGMAFVQNADTNAYIERTFVKTVNGIAPNESGNVVVAGGGGGALQVTDDGNGNISLKNVPTTDNDPIVEWGRSNGWDYIKRASGNAECWRTVTATVATTDWKDSGMMSLGSAGSMLGLSDFGLFWTKDVKIQLPYPFTFASHPVETTNMTNGTVWFPLFWISTTNKQLDKTDSYRICTYKIPDQDIEVTFSFRVVGKWK